LIAFGEGVDAAAGDLVELGLIFGRERVPQRRIAGKRARD
jgi:hypothetical protein